MLALMQGDKSDSDDDISVIEPTLLGLTPVQATEAVKAIRDFIITLDDSGEREREFLSSLSAMEDAFSRLQIKQMRQRTAKSKDDYSRNFKCFSFVLFPFYDSYHRPCCVTMITS